MKIWNNDLRATKNFKNHYETFENCVNFRPENNRKWLGIEVYRLSFVTMNLKYF